jgi:hypothetical protein
MMKMKLSLVIFAILSLGYSYMPCNMGRIEKSCIPSSSFGCSRLNRSIFALSMGSKDKSRRHMNKVTELIQPRNGKMDILADKYDDVIEDDLKDFKTGSDMRSRRERDLKAEFVAQSPVERLVDGGTDRKWQQEKIDSVLKCLNMLYEEKEGKGIKLSYSERVGEIEWDDFKRLAGEAGVLDWIKGGDSAKEFSRIKDWINYHRKKGDIKFVVNPLKHAELKDGRVDRWQWIPRPKYKRNAMRTKVNIRHRKIHGLMNPDPY